MIKGEKYLGFLVSNEEIKPNPKNIQVILNMTSP
jgi:hypothetical protein